jgi:hypothetical protein
MLIEHGADIGECNAKGVNAVHIAAQGNQAAMIYYLIKSHEFEVDEIDQEGNTALHWAAVTGSEDATTFLLAIGANPNALNSSMDTPLHLAVYSIEEHWCMRNIKSLLLEGANRNFRNIQGMIPIDYAEKISNKALQNDLLRVLQPSQSMLCCQLRTPMKKLEKSWSTVWFFFFLLFINYFGMLLFIFRYVQEIHFIIHTTLIVLLAIQEIILIFMDPGFIKKDEAIDFGALVKTGIIDKVCPS